MLTITAIVLVYILGFATAAILAAGKAEDERLNNMADKARRDLNCKR